LPAAAARLVLTLTGRDLDQQDGTSAYDRPFLTAAWDWAGFAQDLRWICARHPDRRARIGRDMGAEFA